MTISIYMMNPKNLRKFFEITSIAFVQESSFNHIFSNCTKFSFPRFFIAFIGTFLRTIFSFVAKGVNKNFSTMITCVLCLSFIYLSFIITFCRTIFSFIASGRNMGKNFITNLTIFSYLQICSFCFTRSRAILCSFKLMFFNIKIFFAKYTGYKFSSSNFFRYLIHAVN